MFRPCSSCKKPIPLNAKYYVCTVSSCQRGGTNFAFCSTDCWDTHLPLMRHKEAWAEERVSPAKVEATIGAQTEPVTAAPVRVTMSQLAPAARATRDELPQEVLIVVSKLKNYIRAKSGMNTSDAVIDVLSERVREMADLAIAEALAHGRKTVLDRDLEPIRIAKG